MFGWPVPGMTKHFRDLVCNESRTPANHVIGPQSAAARPAGSFLQNRIHCTDGTMRHSSRMQFLSATWRDCSSTIEPSSFS